ncbi:hypothetical protein BLNAU_10800 [Blattamonas nauphoetae]|uniref:Uncharacterized protein n=1 Tax=Blattamonas nauphoetae TaxID=2049346 RepID=A0ABQ9XQF5_9EUKA|nr:hypothetical protein BLNAU_10800 [Blattamonas nauphoetae]
MMNADASVSCSAQLAVESSLLSSRLLNTTSLPHCSALPSEVCMSRRIEEQACGGSVTLSGPSSLSLSASPHSPHLRDSCTVHAGLSFLLAALHTPLTATRCEKHPNIPCGAHHVDRNEADSDGAGEEGDNCVEIVSRCPDERVGDR